MSTDAASVLHPPRAALVELVGPAAAGKTALLGELRRLAPWIRPGLRPAARQHLTSAPALLPIVATLHRPYQGLRWKETKRVLYLLTLARLAAAHRRATSAPLVLDEGPVYMLARLRVFGGEVVRRGGFAEWWEGAIRRWADALDHVVWLDATDEVLLQRLRTRRQEHPVRWLADDEVIRFLDTYREAYARVLEDLALTGRVTVRRFRSDLVSTEEIAGEVLAAIGGPG